MSSNNWPTAKETKARLKQKLKLEQLETERAFRRAVTDALSDATTWPIIVEDAAYLALSNPVLKQVEDELQSLGYTTSVNEGGMLVIEPGEDNESN